MSSRKPYPTDLTDAEWEELAPMVPSGKPGGRPCDYEKREILNAIFYIVRSGCAWRLLPHDLPPWGIVYHYFRIWRQEGLWAAWNYVLRGAVRRAAGREVQPSAAILDSQSRPQTAAENMASMCTSKSTVGSDMCWWTRWVYWSSG